MMKDTSENLKKQKTKRQKQKGITLIALVITVIVLLILAGTAITLSINGGNLFSKTNEAANEWNTAVAKEKTAMKKVLSVLDELSPSPVTVSTDIPAKWKDSTNISKVATAGERTVPIPSGFTVSEIEGENTISGGLVIYQVENTATTGNFWIEPDDNDENLLKCQTTYNQFVWIPVDDINQMVMCKENTGDSVCNLILQSDGSLKCMTHHANDNSTELCGRLYGVDTPTVPAGTSAEKPYVSEIKMNFNKREQTWEETRLP